jgi:oxygen-dependent protoporphyrinogen oxidase
MPSNDANRKTYIVVKNRLVPLPDGLMFLIPTKLVPTALSGLFSPATKIRMALELLHPPRPSGQDESVAALVRRHFGQEAVDRLADPLLSGIYGGDATQLSARTVLPKLVEMETEYGSLTRGMLAAHRMMRAKMAAARSGNSAGPATGGEKRSTPRSIFTTLKGGLQQLVNALEGRLNPKWIRKSTTVSALDRMGDGWRVRTNGVDETYDAVIVASPAWAAGGMLAATDAGLGDELNAIPYSSSITVNLVFDEAQLGRLPDGFGFLVPAVEERAMLACTFVHRKFAGRTPTGKAVLRAFLGGAKNEALLEQSDEVLVATVRRELSEILGARVVGPHIPAEATQVSRWRRAMAQYAVGHQERMKRVKEHVAELPGLRLAGNAYDGIGIPDCIRTGRNAAKELMAEKQPVATNL